MQVVGLAAGQTKGIQTDLDPPFKRTCYAFYHRVETLIEATRGVHARITLKRSFRRLGLLAV